MRVVVFATFLLPPPPCQIRSEGTVGVGVGVAGG